MKRMFMMRVLGVLAAFSIFVFSTGGSAAAAGKTMKSQTEVNMKKIHSQNSHNGSIVAGTLQPYLEYEKRRDGSYQFTFIVKNQTEQVQKVTFTSGKKYDYILYRNGKKVTQYSEGKAFIQIYEERILKQGEKLSFTETFKSLPKGHYTLKWWLADPNWPNAKATVTFTVK